MGDRNMFIAKGEVENEASRRPFILVIGHFNFLWEAKVFIAYIEGQPVVNKYIYYLLQDNRDTFVDQCALHFLHSSPLLYTQ